MQSNYVELRSTKFVAIIVALFVVIFGLLMFNRNQASALCEWRSTTWGQGWACPYSINGSNNFFSGQTQDILTDGMCVHTTRHNSDGWFYNAGSQSCGGVVSWDTWPSNNIDTVRLVRDNGNFRTLYP